MAEDHLFELAVASARGHSLCAGVILSAQQVTSNAVQLYYPDSILLLATVTVLHSTHDVVRNTVQDWYEYLADFLNSEIDLFLDVAKEKIQKLPTTHLH